MGDGPLDISVTVLIPTRNEEEAIQETIRSVPNNGWCKELDFLIIDADSRDRTRELAEAEGAKVHIERRGVTAGPTKLVSRWQRARLSSQWMPIVHTRARRFPLLSGSW